MINSLREINCIMIDEKIAELIDNMEKQGVIEAQEKPAYVYAYTLAAERIITFTAIGIIAFIVHRLPHIIIFLAALMLLRRRTGGLHMDTFGQCFIGTNLVCLIVELFEGWWLRYLVIIVLLSVIAVIYICFVGTVNHPALDLSTKELMASRKRARITAVIELLVMLVLILVKADIAVIGYTAMGINICALLLCISRIQLKEETADEEQS